MSAPPATTPAVPASSIGERLRSLRVASGLTQAQLAGERFSKAYVSQIERGSTRPTTAAVAWLADRLGVDASFLGSGVQMDIQARIEARLARAEALDEARRHAEAAEIFAGVRSEVGATGSAELEVRALSGEAWARLQEGDPRGAVELLLLARELAEGPQFSDVERAELLFKLGVCRHGLASIATAASLFDEALSLATRSDLPCDQLRARILVWRSRCHRRQRDLASAQADAEAALELLQGRDDPGAGARANLDAALVAEKQGHWIASRSYAEKARATYEDQSDQRDLSGLRRDLGRLHLTLGRPREAADELLSAVSLAIEAHAPVEAGQALGELATVQHELGDYDAADASARRALALLDEGGEAVEAIGRSQLALGRALLERARLDEAETCFQAADAAFEQLASPRHRATAWVARGDLARRRGDDAEAARLYRIAAESLQDIHF